MADVSLQLIKEGVKQGNSTDFCLSGNGVLRYRGMMYVFNDRNLGKEIFKEAHNTKFVMHSESTKMYRDLQKHYWWHGMRRDIVEYVSRCLICQYVNAEHQKSRGLLQPLPILEWKWEHISIDFMIGLSKNHMN